MNKTATYILFALLAVVAIVAIAFILPLFKDDAETETFYCGPGKTMPVKVFKDPTKAFPSFAKELTSNLKSSIDAVDSIRSSPSIKTEGSIELNSKVVQLRDKLDQESTRMEMIMKSNFFAYNSKPCDSSISRQYFDLLKLIAEKNSSLEELRAELTQPSSKGGDTTHISAATDTSQIRDAIDRFYARYTFGK